MTFSLRQSGKLAVLDRWTTQTFEGMCTFNIDMSRHLCIQPLRLLLSNHKHQSQAQRIHPAFDTCNELLRDRRRCTFHFILGLIDLVLDVSFLHEQFFEFFKMWTSRGLPIGICQQLSHSSATGEVNYRSSL